MFSGTTNIPEDKKEPTAKIVADVALPPVKAFITAEGHGRNTTGGRGYPPVFVTNLNNSGSGSLREALSGGNRIVVFRVGGTITITSDLVVSGSNITIAGQTAPGGGITVYGDITYFTGENIIVRHMRFRAGDPVAGLDTDTFRIQSQSNAGTWENYIMDHCSFSWSSDENVSIETGTSGNVHVNNVTFQNCIFSEGFDSRNMILWGKNITNISVIRNYFANTQQRNIRASVAGNVSWEQINNFVYNYGIAVNPSNKHKVDVIGNVFEDGPATQLVNTINFDECSASNCPPSGDTDFTGTALYHTDNTFNGGPISVSGNVSSYTTGAPNLSSGYSALASSVVKDSVLVNAGARVGLPGGRDALDTHVINDGYNGTGSWPSNEAATSGLPTISNGTPYTDANNDGIDDSWSSTHGISSPSQVKSSYTINGDNIDNSEGWSAMDVFLGYLANDMDNLEPSLEPEPEPFPIPQSKLTKKRLTKIGL